MKTQNIIFIALSLIVVALMLPVVLVMFSGISAVVVIGDEQVRVPKGDTTLLTLFIVILPILVVIGMVMQFMKIKSEQPICKSCIWFLRDLTCGKGFELYRKKCEGMEL